MAEIQKSKDDLKVARKFNATYEIDQKDPDEIRDGYQLRFIGKDYAKLQAGLKTETVLVPDTAHNNAPENRDSQNVFIAGDNLDALKHLENAYTGKVDVIYIDPPYNTGSDGFVYGDNFKFTDEQLKEKLGLTDTEVTRVRALTGKSSHSAWLTFMYPRLVIAKRLLADTGVIFVSIDDNEQANLKLLMDEVFGGNYIGVFLWKKNKSGNQNANCMSIQHEYIVSYTKGNNVPNWKTPYSEEDLKDYKEKDENGVFYWKPVKHSTRGKDICLTINGEKMLIEKSVYNETTLLEMIENGEAEFLLNSKKEKQLYKKQRLGNGMLPYSFLDPNKFPMTENGVMELATLFDNVALFDNPKPTYLIKYFISIISNKSALIIDFFAGSGTTADAVMQLNKEDGGNRHYILCTLDEPCNPASEAAKAGYITIDEISRERIRRAAERLNLDFDKINKNKKDLKEQGSSEQNLENPENLSKISVQVYGFKSFYLKTPTIVTLDKIDEFVPGEKLLDDDMLTPFSAQELQLENTAKETDRNKASGTETLLATWLIDDGFDFDTKVKTLTFGDGDKTATAYHTGQRLYILDENWDTPATKSLLNKIGKNELHLQTIIVYAYSLRFEVLTELKTNLKTNLDEDHKVEIIERF
ncbi:type III restriction endonuclease StyLTI [Bacteroidia bacterium]|nr:type III restriction endonuclease StyLTI [Bacteroidia bacterium]